MLCNATRRLGNGKHLILHQRVRGSIRAVRAVRNTRVFQTQTRVVADVTAANAEYFTITASFTYISYCDTIRIHLRAWSQCSEIAKMRLCVMQHPAKTPQSWCCSGWHLLIIGWFSSLGVAEPNRGYGSSFHLDHSSATRNCCYH